MLVTTLQKQRNLPESEHLLLLTFHLVWETSDNISIKVTHPLMCISKLKCVTVTLRRIITHSLAFCRLFGGSLLQKISNRSRLLKILSIRAWISFSTTTEGDK